MAATTSQPTIQGKFVPGKLEKIRLTNQPVELAKMAFTVSSMPCACAGALSNKRASAAREKREGVICNLLQGTMVQGMDEIWISVAAVDPNSRAARPPWPSRPTMIWLAP